jgi:hypothetical protein
MHIHELVPDRQTFDRLLSGHWEHIEPSAVISGITPQQACQLVDGLPYSIGQIVAHMHWWQQRRLEIAQEQEPGGFELQKDDWPEVAEADWDGVAKAFLESFEEMLTAVEEPGAIQRLVFGDRNVGCMLVSHTLHNAYHLGQIVLMRRMQGTWVE